MKLLFAGLMSVVLVLTPEDASFSVGVQMEVVSGPMAVADVSGIHCETCYGGGGNHHFHGDDCGSGSPQDCYSCHQISGSKLDFCHTANLPGPCSWHSSCHGSFAEVERTIETGDLVGLRQLLAESGGKVTLNRDRRAVQVSDCSGEQIVGHYVISEAWLVALSE